MSEVIEDLKRAVILLDASKDSKAIAEIQSAIEKLEILIKEQHRNLYH